MSTPPFDEIIRAINKYDNFMVVAHVGPDGDAIGSGLALKFALEGLGKKAVVISQDGVPQSSRFLPRHEEVLRIVPNDFARDFKLQCVFIIDCDGTSERVAAPYGLIETAPHRILIDHHRSSRPIFETNWIDVDQPATALMIFQLLEKLPVQMTPDIAQCLMCGLSTDTGHFRFSNTTPEALRAAATLVEHGADCDLVAFKLFDERSRESTHLLGLALSKMQSACDGQLMWTTIEAKDFETANAGDEASENIVNFLRNIRGVRMALILRERRDEGGAVTRISVRCEQTLRADLFSGQFGGGGHAAAAGCRVRRKPFDESVQIVIDAARKWIEEENVEPAV
jgi:phosphoesterase RecJ-like protein